MPLPAQDMLFSDEKPVVYVALEPAHNMHHSLFLLSRADDYSGFDEWVYRSAMTMTQEERETNLLVMVGLYYASRPMVSYASFPALVESLYLETPMALRNKVLDAYIDMIDGDGHRASYDDILRDVNSFLTYLRRGFDDAHLIPEVERRAYTYLVDPPALHQLVVEHLRSMWHKYLAVEWDRVRPMLQKAVRSFATVDLSAMDRMAATEYVIGRPIRKDDWHSELEKSGQIIFVPSAHVGPYTKKFTGNGRTWIIFGARQPEDTGEVVAELSRAELLVRLNALADDYRLNILRLVADQGELRSQEIMQILDMSQSGASRHLQQLTAAGFLNERRCNGAKCFTLSRERVDTTLDVLRAYLLPSPATTSSRIAKLTGSTIQSR